MRRGPPPHETHTTAILVAEESEPRPPRRPPSPLGGWTPPGRIDDYRIVRMLAHGGMGAVYLAVDDVLHREIALKVVPAITEAARVRFSSEARALARLQHPNVVVAYRSGELEQHLYLAYEYVPGATLAERTLPMPWPEVLRIGMEAARGLAAAHREGILHRDIKPSNVMCTHQGAVKVIDFGLARLVAPRLSAEMTAVDAGSEATPFDPHTRVTSSHPSSTIAGTPRYMAPEVWEGGAATRRTDVYGLGLLMAQMLTGELPGPGALAHERIAATLASRVPDAPTLMLAVIDECLERNPERRPRSAGQVRDALESIHDARIHHRQFFGPGREVAATVVLESFLRAKGGRSGFAESFYELLFEAHPSVRALFPGDMNGMMQKLGDTLQLLLEHLREPERVVPLLETIGRRHAAYGVTAAHFEAMGVLIQRVLAKRDPQWNPMISGTWTSEWQKMAAVMVRALDEANRRDAPTPATHAPSPEAPGEAALHYASNEGVHLAYQIVGRSGGFALVIPGWVSNLELAWTNSNWRRLWSRLAGSCRVIIADPRGSGLSDRAIASIAIEDRVQDCIAVLDAVGCDSATVVGLGDGAGTALTLAASYPARVRGLVLYGAGARFDEARGPDHAASAWTQRFPISAHAPSCSGDPGFGAWWDKFLRAASSPGSARSMLDLLAVASLDEVARQVSAPTMFLHRDADQVAPLSAARHLVDLVTGSELRLLRGYDHSLFAGDPVPVAVALERFLNTSTSRSSPVCRSTAALAVVVAGHSIELVRREIDEANGDLQGHSTGSLTATFGSALSATRCAIRVEAALAARGSTCAAAVVFGANGTALYLQSAQLASCAPWRTIVVTAEVRQRLRGSEILLAPGLDGSFVVVGTSACSSFSPGPCSVAG